MTKNIHETGHEKREDDFTMGNPGQLGGPPLDPVDAVYMLELGGVSLKR